jgi:transposase-like protein
MARHGLSLIDIQSAFGTEAQCLDYLEAARWPEGVTCLKCGSDKVSKFVTNKTTRERKNRKGEIKEVTVPSRRLFQCNNEGCRHQFSPTAATIFDKTHLPLATWFKAIGLLCNAKKSISAKQMERDLGVNYRTAWHLDHRIREAMQSPEGLFSGTVEVDATFVGGEYDERRQRSKYGKQAVAGVMQRTIEDSHSKVVAKVIKRETAAEMKNVIRQHIAPDANVMTDEHRAYMALRKNGWKHEIVAHTKEEWVRGNVHTQGIENFWSLFKRGVIGSFHSVSVKHLHRYLNEFSFRFNNRESQDIFNMVVANLLIGSALRYKALTAKISTEAVLLSSSEPE